MDAQASNPASLIEADGVHAYVIDLRQDDPCVASLYGILDERERTQAARFATSDLKRKYIVSHGATRLILSQYVSYPANRIEFVHNAQGKPSLLPELRSLCQFNLSHSGEICLVALAHDRAVGVDVERIRPLQDWQAIASRFFSPREAEELNQLPESLVIDGFFAAWSRKEAYIKALGLGLSLELDAFAVQVDPRKAAQLLWTRDPSQGPEMWCMKDVAVPAEYRAAVVVQGQGCRISYPNRPFLHPLPIALTD